jgi:actin-related protein 6
MDEARRYCSLPADGKLDKKDGDNDTNKFEDKKKPELSQNVRLCAFITCQMLLCII